MSEQVQEAAPQPAADAPKAKAPRKPKAKAAKPTSDKPKGNVDTYGFSVTSIKSKAAAMYAAKSGATVAEVKKATGSLQLNLLTELEKDGYKVKRVKESGQAGRSVTRYFLAK